MRISYCRHRYDPLSEQREVEDLRTLATHKGKEDAPLWSPCLFSDNSRKDNKATEVNALVLDFDLGRPLKTLFEGMGVEHVWHTSASHTAEKPKWRLIVPLSAPVPAKAWPSFWLAATTLFQLTGFDEACKNANRFYFVPPKGCEWEEHKGQLLNPHEIEGPKQENLSALRKALISAKNVDYVLPIRAALSGRPIADEGNRSVTVNGLGFYLGRSVLDENVSLEAVTAMLRRGFLLPGKERAEHWENIFKVAFEKGRAARKETREASEKAQSLDGEWARALQTAPRMDGSVIVVSNTYNANIILRNASPWQVRHNVLEEALEISKDGADFRAFLDTDATTISNWLQLTYKIKLTKQQTHDQLAEIAPNYDPLKAYQDGLPKWDGNARISNFLSDYLGVGDIPEMLVRAYSRKWLVGLVARALDPGCKFDTVLVLQGNQGIGKSTAVRYLCEPWFSDSRVPIGDKDALAQAARFWAHEIGELASFRRVDLETLKQHFSSVSDSYRPPYGRTVITKPRRTVYIGTTNDETFLQDETGNRRFWCVRCIGKIRTDLILKDRPQIFAEAKDAYMKGEEHFLNEEERVLHDAYVQGFENDRSMPSSYEDKLMSWWMSLPMEARPSHFTVSKMVEDVINIPVDKMNHLNTILASKALKNLGWKRVRMAEDEAGRRVWAYTPPPEWFRLPQKKGGKVVDFKVESGKGDLIEPG